MRKKIAILRSDVINQIAAGEVLENPASAVKELVENAIDAESESIRVEIKGGGHHWICVEDDGVGMCREDALECLQRHATSKIRETDDLLVLSTMGFRGEALAAIASVSQMEIQTSDLEESTSLHVEAGRVVSIEPCARNRGTTIDVRSLFYNVPARQKFQKSATSSASQILRTMQIIALGWPQIAFTLYSENKLVLRVEKQTDWRLRAEEVLGNFPHEISKESGHARVYGLVGAPLDAKGNRSGQYVFVNRRPIVSPLIARAVKDAYATRLIEGKFPSFVLFLELPSDEVDVNVHPQKRDVRFQDEGKIYRLIERAVSEAFSEESSPNFLEPLTFQKEPLPWDKEFCATEIEKTIELVQLELAPSKDMQRRPVALMGSLALFEGDPFSLLDLKGAEARLLFDRMHRESSAVQSLFIPREVVLSLEEAQEGEYWADELKKLNVEARYLGGRLLVVDALPVGLEVDEVAEFFSQWKRDRKAASTICRLCRSRKKRYTLQEAALIDQELRMCSDSIYDPLGRIIQKEIREEHIMQWLSHD